MSTMKWEMDPAHTQIRFTAKHMIVSRVSGSFDDFEASVETDGDDLESAKITFSAKTASVNTGVKQRDEHLRSDDFFNSEEYPELTFKSTSFKKVGEDDYKMEGNLTIRDVTKPVTFDVEYGGSIVSPSGQQRAGFAITGKVNRKEFGLKYNALIESGGAVVGENISLDIHAEFIHE